MEKNNQLLEYFEVSNHQELLELVRNNPTNEKVVELKTFLAIALPSCVCSMIKLRSI